MSGRSPRMLSILALAFVSSMAAGCAIGPFGAPVEASRPESAARPAWYLEPPRDTDAALYGVGAARGLPQAKSAALVDVASKLSISVRATSTDRSVLHNDRLDQRIENELVAHVQDRAFRAYDVVETAFAAGDYYALVRVDRSRLILDTLDGLRRIASDVSSRLERVSERESLAYYIAFREVEPSLGRAEASVQLLSALSPHFDAEPHRARHRAYREEFERTRAELVVRLVPDARSGSVAAVVQQLLSDAGLRSEVVASVAASACSDLCIAIESEWEGHYAVRRHIAKLKTTFRIRDTAGTVSSAREHRVKATALASETKAREAATAELLTALTQEGILPALGLSPSVGLTLAEQAGPRSGPP